VPNAGPDFPYTLRLEEPPMSFKKRTHKRDKNTIKNYRFFFSGRFFFLFAGCSVALVPAYFLFGSYWFLIGAVNVALLILALVDLLIGPSKRDIRLERPLPLPLAVDRPSEVSIKVTNLTGRSVVLRIQDDVPPRCIVDSLPLRATVSQGSRTRLKYRLTPLARGNGEFGNIHFWVKGPLGLIWKKWESEAAATVKLYPGLALIERQRMKVRLPVAQDAIRPYWLKGAGTEFDSLREYSVGDDSRLVHWSTSARKGKLFVRQNRVERSQNMFLMLDAGRMMTARVHGRTKLDHGLESSLLLSYAALELGDKVGLMAVAQELLCFIPPANLPDQFGRLLDATYALEARMEEPGFYLALSNLALKLRRRSLVVIFTDLIDERASEGLIRYSLALLPRHLPLVVTMSDTEVIDLADSMPTTEHELYRKGVAAEMIDRRERVLARLTSAGVMVLDAAPDKISVSVLERYMDIKTRNIL
jgi:uncharacterized protein (DUF58 family)